MDYKNGKIYSIRSFQTDKYYIGSTTQSLSKRLSKHGRDYKIWCKDNNKSFLTSYEILKFGDAYIELIEICECNTKDELQKREGELIRKFKNDIVNICIPKRTDAEYREDNKLILSEKSKQYKDEHRALINAKTQCSCGCVVAKSKLKRHKESQKHNDFIAAIP